MQKIDFVVFPGFQTMSMAALSVFEFANLTAVEPVYDVRVVSEHGGLVTSSIGLQIQTQTFRRTAVDTVLVGGGTGITVGSPGLLAHLRRAQSRCRRVGSICTGAFVLAEAGVLDGRSATTHWAHARNLAAMYPRVKVDEDRIFTVDGAVWTSAGMTAGVDLALAMVEKDLGAERARQVAKMLVVYHRRAGGQSQFSVLLELQPKSDRIQRALDFARSHLKTPLSVDSLAEAASLSPRQFSRAFHTETGQTPAKAIENLRVEAARLMMEQGKHPIEVIATETGFADRERMRRAFLRAFGQSPQAMQRSLRPDVLN